LKLGIHDEKSTTRRQEFSLYVYENIAQDRWPKIDTKKSLAAANPLPVRSPWEAGVLGSSCPYPGRELYAPAKKSRTRFLITRALVCHLLLAAFLFTGRLLGQTAPGPLSSPSSLRQQDVSIQAVEQEKQGPHYTLKGDVVIHYGVFVLRADEITYNSDTGDAKAAGHVVLEGGPFDEHVEADSAAYNINSEVGRFERVHGTVGLKLHNKRTVLTSSNPFVFSGKVVEKTGPGHYLVYDGMITTCELPRPKWQFNAGKIVVDAGGNATIYNSIFRIRGIPILYLPFATHPIDRQARQSGFLMPNIGHSSIKGTILGDKFYWAINHRMDITFGADYYSQRGWAPLGEFRARPTEHSFVDLNVFSVLDRKSDSGADVQLNAEDDFSDDFRGVINAEYLSSYAFRLTFYDLFSQIANSEVISRGFVSKNNNGFSYNAGIEQYRNFESSSNISQVVSILHAPGAEVSSVDRALGHTPLYWRFDAAADGLSRSEPTFSTPLLGRIDVSPTVSLPLMAHDWSLVPSFTLRDTIYSHELLPSGTPGVVGTATGNPVNRQALEGSVELIPPPVERVFAKSFLGRKWKHVIEPRATYNYVTGIHNFGNILRFDDRDILSDTNEVEYSLVNRLYAKRIKPVPDDCDNTKTLPFLMGGNVQQSYIPWEKNQTAPACSPEPEVREVVSWELTQKYFLDPTFGGALVPGQRNVFTTTADLTGIAFLTSARRLSPLISRLRIQTSSRTDAAWELDYDFTSSKINASTALVNYHMGPFTIGGGEALMQVPFSANPVTTGSPPSFDQFRLLLAYGNSGKRGFSGAASAGYDVNVGSLQYSSLQAAYNWDCCGFNVEYRRFELGSVPNENQFRFSFVLSNIGGFGNLKRQERLF
jgi:LPS-assembly protein